MKSKKVVLLIVEGISDEIALAVPLRRLFATQPAGESIEFQVVHGDITTDKVTKTINIKGKVVEKVKDFLGQSKILPTDLMEIVLLVDTDGAYIPDDAIREDDTCQKPLYTDGWILCKDRAAIAVRNQQKRKSLDLLASLSKLRIGGSDISFSVYYFSCNLDHVLHNEANLAQKQKTKLAEEFERKYESDPSGLLRFLADNSFTKSATYEDSWAYIKEGAHSLQRGTNLVVFLSLQARSIPHGFMQLLSDTYSTDLKPV